MITPIEKHKGSLLNCGILIDALNSMHISAFIPKFLRKFTRCRDAEFINLLKIGRNTLAV